MSVSSCSSCASGAATDNAASIIAMRKALETEKQMASQLLPTPRTSDDSAGISDEAMKLYEESIAALSAAEQPAD